jgi:hypothetical protein
MDIQWWPLRLHHKIERKKLWPKEHNIEEGCLNAFYFHILIIAKFEYMILWMMTTPTTSQNRKKHNNTEPKHGAGKILNKQDPTYWYSLTYKLPGHCLLCQKKTLNIEALALPIGSSLQAWQALELVGSSYILFHFFVNRKLKSDFLIMPLTVYRA